MTESNSIDLMTELAKKRRSQVVETEINSEDAGFIEKINYSLVKFWMRESALPLAQVNVDLLVDALGVDGGYGSQLAPVTPGDLVGRYSSDELYRMTPSQLLSAVFKRETSKVATFEGGKFPIKHDFVPIQQIRIERYGVGVLVGGTSRVAETIAQEVVELLWATAGSRRTFDDCRHEVMSTLYGCQTRVKAPVNLDNFLSPTLRKFIDGHLLGGERLAAKMRAIESGETGKPEVAVVVAPNAVNFTVYTMNLQTGVSEQAALSFQVIARGDNRSGLIDVTSALKYEDHVRLLSALFEKVEAERT
jgi:hypothetical protein